MNLLLLLFLVFGCGTTDLSPIRGSAIRVAPPSSPTDNQELRVYIFSSEAECNDEVGAENVHLCLPYVDRASGQVRIAFQMRVDGSPWAVPLSEDNMEIFHKNQRVTRDGKKRYRIIPHDPVPAEQLFVLLIDASGSMSIDDDRNGRTRMDKLKAALLRPDVVDAFFPAGVETAVAPLIFRDGTPQPLGGKWIVENKKDYRALIKNELQVGSGFTYFYGAVNYATSTLLEVPEIKAAISNKKQQPTIIALTDGFNNELPKDVCGDNAPRLEGLLKKLDGVRRGDVDIRYRPTVFTVGLGRMAWREPPFEVPDGLTVSARQLCRGKAAEIINGGIENGGVDNGALAWIARVGGGNSYVSRTPEGLAEAFLAAAAKRYKWFEARYQVDPFFLRRSFEAKLRLSTLLRTESSIWVHPSGWLDAPPGVRDAEGWASASSYLNTTTLVFPILGALAALGYLPAALFNVRRALFSRVARKRRRPGT